MVGEVGERGFVEVDFDECGAAGFCPDGEVSRGGDQAAGADDEHHLTFRTDEVGTGDIGGVEEFAEPDDARAGEAAAFDTGGNGLEVVAACAGFVAALGAAVDHHISVKRDDVGVSGCVVETVDILGDDSQIGYDPGEIGEGVVPRVGFDTG